jgi:hypothetical protein
MEKKIVHTTTPKAARANMNQDKATSTVHAPAAKAASISIFALFP